MLYYSWRIMGTVSSVEEMRALDHHLPKWLAARHVDEHI